MFAKRLIRILAHEAGRVNAVAFSAMIDREAVTSYRAYRRLLGGVKSGLPAYFHQLAQAQLGMYVDHLLDRVELEIVLRPFVAHYLVRPSIWSWRYCDRMIRIVVERRGHSLSPKFLGVLAGLAKGNVSCLPICADVIEEEGFEGRDVLDVLRNPRLAG